MNQTEAEGRPADRRSLFQQSEGVPEQMKFICRGIRHIRKIRGGEKMNTKAEIQKLALQNMWQAYKIAWKYRGRGIEQEELQSAALYGLVKAASGYDSSREVPFPAFACAVMRNTVRMEFRRVKKDRRCVSMEERIVRSEEGGNSCVWADRIACRETGFDQVEEKDFLPSLFSISELTGKEQKLVWLVVCNGMTQKEAGKRTGLSRPRVSRHIRSGMEKIRKKYMETMYPAGTAQGMIQKKQAGGRDYAQIWNQREGNP